MHRIDSLGSASRVFGAGVSLILCVVLSAGRAAAQDMEPRSYSNAPVGMNFLVASYAKSSGGVITPTTVPVSNVEADVYSSVLAFVRAEGIFGQSGKILVAVPYVWGNATGDSPIGRISGRRSGLADPVLKFSFTFLGAPALTRSEFINYHQKTIVGASFQVTAPLGQYDPNRTVNLGANRWSFKPEIGISRAIERWTLEAYANTTFFSANSEYLGNSVLRQDPLTMLQGHAAYTFRPGLWAAIDLGFLLGGDATLNGVPTGGKQRNVRSGITFSLPLKSRQSLKLFVSTGLYATARTNFTTVGVAYQFSWFRWPLSGG